MATHAPHSFGHHAPFQQQQQQYEQYQQEQYQQDEYQQDYEQYGGQYQQPYAQQYQSSHPSYGNEPQQAAPSSYAVNRSTSRANVAQHHYPVGAVSALSPSATSNSADLRRADSKGVSHHDRKGSRGSKGDAKWLANHETSAEKEAKRLHTKADPTLAMNELEPSVEAAMGNRVGEVSIRAIMHRDPLGNPIGEPDISNPTRNRWERPLDTIRSFEAARYGPPRTYTPPDQSTWNRRSGMYSVREDGSFGGEAQRRRSPTQMNGNFGHSGSGSQNSSVDRFAMRQPYPSQPSIPATMPMAAPAAATPPSPPQKRGSWLSRKFSKRR